MPRDKIYTLVMEFISWQKNYISSLKYAQW